MKAIEIIQKELKLVDFPIPEPGPGEVLIKVKATAINRADLMQKKRFVPASSWSKSNYGARMQRSN